jgi:hypothetical protein
MCNITNLRSFNFYLTIFALHQSVWTYILEVVFHLLARQFYFKVALKRTCVNLHSFASIGQLWISSVGKAFETKIILTFVTMIESLLNLYFRITFAVTLRYSVVIEWFSKHLFAIMQIEATPYFSKSKMFNHFEVIKIMNKICIVILKKIWRHRCYTVSAIFEKFIKLIFLIYYFIITSDFFHFLFWAFTNSRSNKCTLTFKFKIIYSLTFFCVYMAVFSTCFT